MYQSLTVGEHLSADLLEYELRTVADALRHVRRRRSDSGLPEHGARAGDIGTVVERHVVPGVSEEGYSVEFFDMAGNTVAVTTLPARAAHQDIDHLSPEGDLPTRRGTGAGHQDRRIERTAADGVEYSAGAATWQQAIPPGAGLSLATSYRMRRD